MEKEEYHKWIEENDTYPEHSHKWIVRTYTQYGETKNMFYRNFGPFKTSQEAKKFLDNYKEKYTTKGFITMFSIEPICEILTDSLDKSKESELLEKLIWDKFVIDTKELDDDFKEVLYDNLWDLYIKGEEK